MSLLAAPLEEEEIEDLRQLFPEYEGDIPEEARYWSRSDLELFLGSGGQLRPRESAQSSSSTCALLSRLRLKLADDNVSDLTAEYKSFCRHRKERDEVHSLPSLAGSTLLQRVARAPDFLKSPVLASSPRDWRAKGWGMDFWKKEYGEEWWKFRARSPAFDDDARGSAADGVAVEGTASEYVDYVRVVQKMDPSCQADSGVAFPRVAMDSWTPFAGAARGLFEDCWKELRPAAARDLTSRWVKMFAGVFNMDWLEFLSRSYRVTIGAPGTISRLHRENNGAHVWFAQLEGRRLFVLFGPREVAAGRLYEESGGLCGGAEGYAAAASPVDLFFPSQRRHPKFAEATAQVAVLRAGETLVVPGGWWHYSVALEPSVTLHHPFWNAQNRIGIVEEFREAFDASKMPPELQEMADRNLQQLRERIRDDDDSDMDDD